MPIFLHSGKILRNVSLTDLTLPKETPDVVDFILLLRCSSGEDGLKDNTFRK